MFFLFLLPLVLNDTWYQVHPHNRIPGEMYEYHEQQQNSEKKGAQKAARRLLCTGLYPCMCGIHGCAVSAVAILGVQSAPLGPAVSEVYPLSMHGCAAASQCTAVLLHCWGISYT